VDERFLAPEGAQGISVEVGTLLAAALRAQPDVIVLGARISETREIAAYLRRHRVSIPVVCSDGSYVLPPDRQSRDLSDLDGFYIVRFWSPERDSAAAAFSRAFTDRYGYAPDQSEALTYDAVMLVGAAVRDGGRSADEVARIIAEYGWRRQGYKGLVMPEYSFARGRPRTATPEMAIVRGGMLHGLGSDAQR
jgi:ABC-type branched-subunit amino acid transport system substrate-binding protein